MPNYIHERNLSKLTRALADLTRHVESFQGGEATVDQEWKANHLVERIQWYTLVHLSPIHKTED